MAFDTGLNSPDLSWLDDRRLADALKEQAYEHIPARQRALLKRGLQLGHAFYGALESTQQKGQNLSSHGGYLYSWRKNTVDWVLLLLPEDYSAAARLLALALLPRLCRVPDVFAVVLGDHPRPEALLSLELCGIEDTFCLQEEQLKLLLATITGQGRILSLAHPLPELSGQAPPVHREERPPRLTLLSPELFSHEDLTFLHGPTGFESPLENADAVFGSEEKIRQLLESDRCHDCLLLQPGCEGFWREKNLHSDLFQDTKVSFQALTASIPPF